jgi:hypothetical protein
MDRQRSQAIQALEIFDHSVKCQRCGNAVPIVGKLTKANNDRIGILQKRIKWIEEHYYHRNKDEDIKLIKQELAELLEEDAKYDKLRSLPLYSCRITDWKFVCSRCYDRVYYNSIYHKGHLNSPV